MTTFADSLKREIARVARKELKTELAAMRKSIVSHRSEIAALKKQLKEQHSMMRQLVKMANRAGAAAPAVAPAEDTAPAGEFNREAFLERRKELGLTQVQMAKVIGVSALSITRWESGKASPRAAQRASIEEARKLGKRRIMELANG